MLFPKGGGLTSPDKPRPFVLSPSVWYLRQMGELSFADSTLLSERADGESSRALCWRMQQHLFTLDRYINGLRGLRPGQENLLTFDAITGIPIDRAADERVVDFRDRVSREAYYQQLLTDPRMHPTPRADGTLEPTCESEHARATPAPRLVELARRFGDNGACTRSAATTGRP